MELRWTTPHLGVTNMQSRADARAMPLCVGMHIDIKAVLYLWHQALQSQIL